ncbi:hypothetical protein THS27_02795 [Thalassospira sp. MCCC 1A01428]|nr:hypothetical protein THS27_02795 [Thalassospira sp. MCCC 1A01428]
MHWPGQISPHQNKPRFSAAFSAMTGHKSLPRLSKNFRPTAGLKHGFLNKAHHNDQSLVQNKNRRHNGANALSPVL